MENNLPTHKNVRWQEFDYNKHGAYFITICTEGRMHILSEIMPTNIVDSQHLTGLSVGDGVLDIPPIKLLKYGEIAEKYLKQLNDFYDNLSVECYVIMPNHIHFVLFVNNLEPISNNCANDDGGQSRTPVPTVSNSTVSKFVSSLALFTEKRLKNKLF